MENIENPFVNEGTKESLMELADANMKKTAEKEGKEADTLEVPEGDETVVWEAKGETYRIRLGEITQENWLEAVRLELGEGQSAFVAEPLGILARGYVYRDCRARVWTVEEEGRIVGLALVREFDDEPLGYELQQLLIDRREQGRGVGFAALTLVLDRLRAESRWPTVEVCVKKTDAPALRVFEKAGFADSGYIDPAVPDALNLVYTL